MNTTSGKRVSRFLSVAAALAGVATIGGGDLLAQTTPGPQPSICLRSCWNARSGSASEMSALNRAVIHHSAGAGDYNTSSQSQSAAIVRAIQNVHMDSRGWSDIGYHFLVDKLGNTFEGRVRSANTSQRPRGAHDDNNTNSFGFNVLGWYHPTHNQSFTSASRNALWNVIAWRMPSGWSPYGSGTYNGKNVGRVAGHRNVKSTACPGDGVYATIGTNFNGGEARNSIAARRSGASPPPTADDRIDVLARRGGTSIHWRRFHRNNGGWSAFTHLGGNSKGAPAIASWAPGRLDVFYRGDDDKLTQFYHTNGQWIGPVTHTDGTLYSDPAAVSWGPGRIDVAILGGGGNVYQRYFTSGNGWSGWVNLGQPPSGDATSAPALCSRGSGRLNLFVRGSDNKLWHRTFESASGWSGWQDLGGGLTSAPSAVARSPEHINVVVRGGGNNIYQRSWNSAQGWSASWQNLGGSAAGAPAICAWDSNRLDIFIRNSDSNQLQQRFWNGSWSADWANLEGSLTSGPGAVAGQW